MSREKTTLALKAVTEPSQTPKLTSRSINVTNLTPSQRRKLFMDCMDQSSFKGFVKKKTNKQTHYTFYYQT